MQKLCENGPIEHANQQIVMVHEQNFNAPENFSRTGLRDEMREAGVENIYSAIDGDMF
jgi:hypothetical protein